MTTFSETGMADIVVREVDGAAVVECTGEHDMTTRNGIAALLERLVAVHEVVVVDVSEASFVDSSFVNNLFIANGFARRQGARFRVQYAAASSIRPVLELTGILEALACFRSRDECLR
jgi:anti-anti-sigma regulatory factor